MDDPQKDLIPGFSAAWARCFAPDGPLAAPSLPDSPVYPLARTVEMPAGHAYSTGAVGLRLLNLRIDGLGNLARAGRQDAEGRVRVSLAVEGVRIRGEYRLEAKADPVADLDSAGNLMDLRPDALRPAAAGGGSGGDPSDPVQEEWLDTARLQRQKLGETDNGLQLIALYNQHNEVYEEVFRTSATLPGNWRAGGVTRAMAADTNAAVQNDAVVNSATKDYGSGVTYNSNAFVQQLNVAVETVATDPNFDPFTPIDQQNLSGRYWDAAKAALSFGKGVGATTGNSKGDVNEMQPSQVYTTVHGHQGGLPPVTDGEAKAVFGSAMSAGAGGAGAQDTPGWIVIDEEDRRRVRSIIAHRAKARAENAAVRGETLFAGAVEAEIDRIETVVELVLEDGGRARPVAVKVDLPAFALDIDDTAWTGTVAAVARERMAGMLFIRSLLQDSLLDRLNAVLPDAAARAYNGATGAA